MTASFWGDGREQLDHVVEKERAAVFKLFQRETVQYTESIRVYVNPEIEASYPFSGRFAKFKAEDRHIVSASFYNCLQRMGSLPEELRSCERLKEMSFYDTPCFLLLADPTYFRALERLEVRRGPIVDIDPLGMSLSLKELVVKESLLKIPRGLHGLPNLQRADFSYCGLEKVPDMTEARSLEELDLSHNQIASYEGLKNPCSLKKVDLRGNGFLRRLRNYRGNRKVVKELREQGIEVAA